MAYNNLGLTFQPGQTQNGGQNAATPVQRAVQLLSLRLPSVVGARALAPQALLGATGGAGVGAMAGGNVEAALALLRRLQQQAGGADRAPNGPQDYAPMAPSAGTAMTTSASSPAPRVIPGREGDTGGTISYGGGETTGAPRNLTPPETNQAAGHLSWLTGFGALE